ncbi:MAG: hypothetical protein R2867_32455 [Caldilineaceae bacterium]
MRWPRSHRTLLDRLTPNRLTFIGWNGDQHWRALLAARASVAGQGCARPGTRRRHDALCGVGPIDVAGAALALSDQSGEVAALPKDIQHVVGEQPYPILLKCASSPHIYALDRGEKHWIKDIETFEAQGFEWRDIHFTRCETIDAIPTGSPIPANAGAPPDAQ